MRMGWLFGRNNVRAPWIVALLVLLNALLLRALDPSELGRLRDVAFDSFQRIKPRTYHPATPVRGPGRARSSHAWSTSSPRRAPP